MPLPSTPTNPIETPASPNRSKRSRPSRRKILAIGAVIALGALGGTGYGIQSAMAAEAQDTRIAVAASLIDSTVVDPEQSYSYDKVVTAFAQEGAKAAIAAANATVASAQGKTDAAALTTSAANLSRYSFLAPERVFKLVDETKAETGKVQAAVAEVDRVAAEQAAAAAAAQAAAEKAAAEAAAAKQPAVAVRSAASRSAAHPAAPTDPSGAQAIARDLMAAQYGWGEEQFGCLVPLWQRESGWNVNAYNASSGATGIPQALPGSKMASAGADWQTNPATQITWGLGYISERYGTPCAAWDHSESVGWY